MATAYITEYTGIGMGFLGSATAAPQTPSLVEQTVAIGAVASSKPFNNKTKLVRVHVDAICSISFGNNPTATTAMARLAANQTEYYAVVPGQSVSVISNT